MRKIIIGADGGGTKTRFAAYDTDAGIMVARSEAKGINISSWTVSEAISNISQGIQALNLGGDDIITALSIGDPALDDNGTMPKILQNELEKAEILPKDTKIMSCSDVFMALYGFSRGNPAALIVAGTGSMAVSFPEEYRHGKQNRILTVGGWGGFSPDRGSGYDIASTAVFAVMDAADGIAPQTSLTETAMDFFGADSPRDLIRVFSHPMKRAEIASFAKCVDKCALKGDDTAQTIIKNAGDVLGQYAVSLLKSMNSAEQHVGIYGSVLLNSVGVREAFSKRIYESFPKADIGVPEVSPEEGAVYFALDSWEK